jgi:hypothetical protein
LLAIVKKTRWVWKILAYKKEEVYYNNFGNRDRTKQAPLTNCAWKAVGVGLGETQPPLMDLG